MDAIILFSHGSVLCGAERNLLALAQRMRDEGAAPIVEAAFLNYTEPTFEAAVEVCVGREATRIVIAPYFLVSGKFVTRELPDEIARVKHKHPSVEFVTAEVIGFHEALADAILSSAANAQPPEEHSAAIRDAAAWCREDPKCPLYGSEVCRAHPQPPPRQGIPRPLPSTSASAARNDTRGGDGARALLIMPHGSPRPEANGDIIRVAEVLRGRGTHDLVKIGYLDCNQPDIATAVDECVAEGASEIAAVPYFLHSGKHMLRDLPGILTAAIVRHPEVKILMGNYIGQEPQMAVVLRERVDAAVVASSE